MIFRDYPVYFKRGRAERAGLLPAPAFSEAPKKSGVSSQIRQSTDWLFILHNTDMEFLFTESYTHFPQGYPQPVWKTPALQPGSVGLWRGRRAGKRNAGDIMTKKVSSQGDVPSGIGIQVQARSAAGQKFVVPLAADHGGVVFPMKHGFMGAPPI